MIVSNWIAGVALAVALAAPHVSLAQGTTPTKPADENFRQTTQSCDEIKDAERRAECVKQRVFQGQSSTSSVPSGQDPSDRSGTGAAPPSTKSK